MSRTLPAPAERDLRHIARYYDWRIPGDLGGTAFRLLSDRHGIPEAHLSDYATLQGWWSGRAVAEAVRLRDGDAMEARGEEADAAGLFALGMETRGRTVR
jgi:hypothetical protein